MIDLRSDTVTRPSPEMLEAMMHAKVGDDVLGDDPTVKELEEKVAVMFGKEAALFCPSGTMTNQIAINVHTRPGDEVICHKFSHVYYYEGGAMMRNSGVSVCLLEGDRGLIHPDDIPLHINPDDDHRPVTRLVSIENTMNKGGGACYPFSDVVKISKICREKNLALHLDGARLFNALAESTQTPADYGRMADSISICLSKGLGAPVGSLLIGDNDFIKRARRVRKAFGGAMRQAGYLAAAGIFALDHNIARLKEDHLKARDLGSTLEQVSWVDSVLHVETNILIFNVSSSVSAQSVIEQLKSNEIHALAIGPHQIRFVTHLDVSDLMVDEVSATLKRIF